MLLNPNETPRVPYVEHVDPSAQGNADVEAGGKSRRVTVYGVGHEMAQTFRMNVQSGHFLPSDDPRAARAFVVLGAKVKQELFGAANPLGSRIRIGSERYRVIGVMESKGQVLGFDLDDIPGPSQHGLKGMRERSELMGADFQIISRPTEGAVVSVRLPLGVIGDKL